MQHILAISAQINEIIEFLNIKINKQPSCGLILGSGLGEIASVIKEPVVLNFSDIPHIPPSTAPGHAGKLIIGSIADKYCITMQGRLHAYEGYSAQNNTLLVRAFKKLGIETLIITGAAGGLNQNFNKGDIMLIRDHINYSGTNPLVGANLNEFGPRFVVMFDIYTHRLQQIAHKCALEQGIYLQQGVHAGILGPTYATRAELQKLINDGCDSISMSIIQEAIIAAHSNMDILGLLAITDMALPYVQKHEDGDAIIESSKSISKKFTRLLESIISNL